MPRIPGPTMKRYRGRIRASMTSARNHLQLLQNWDTRYRARPTASYPNQLAQVADITQMNGVLSLLNLWLSQLGAIPSR